VEKTIRLKTQQRARLYFMVVKEVKTEVAEVEVREGPKVEKAVVAGNEIYNLSEKSIMVSSLKPIELYRIYCDQSAKDEACKLLRKLA
jgi:hypothetical protein